MATSTQFDLCMFIEFMIGTNIAENQSSQVSLQIQLHDELILLYIWTDENRYCHNNELQLKEYRQHDALKI